MISTLSRAAAHAGSWYDKDPKLLTEQLSSALSAADKFTGNGFVKVLIGPHAGYRFCAKTAAWAYNCIDPKLYKRIILLGPSHHEPINCCAITTCDLYETPLGNIEIDVEGVEKLLRVKGFETMSKSIDEAEHSLEMHLPFLKHIFGKMPVKLIPIIVGTINTEVEGALSQAFTNYMKDNETLFVVSSDFCHWGLNYGFFYYKKEDGEIYNSIEKLDKRAMSLIENIDVEGLTAYFEETENTICGRHPIAIILNVMKATGDKYETKFRHYSQSNQVKHPSEFSVSYAAAYSSRII